MKRLFLFLHLQLTISNDNPIISNLTGMGAFGVKGTQLGSSSGNPIHNLEPAVNPPNSTTSNKRRSVEENCKHCA